MKINLRKEEYLTQSEYGITAPFIFNCWKHHKNFVRSKITEYTTAGANAFGRFIDEIKQIGESQTDFYYGNLSPRRIEDEIKSFLIKEGIGRRAEYTAWLSADESMYKVIYLSDGSAWALRLGTAEERFVHFHPGRRSPFTLRIKAVTLKSAVAAIIWSGIFKLQYAEVSTVNEARKHLLALPPVKSLAVNKSIFKVIELLGE